MRYRQLGKTTLRVSSIGLGCNSFGGAIDYGTARELIWLARDEGINFFDTADVYGNGDSERFLGEALGSSRSDAIIATKFGAPGAPVDGADMTPSASRRYINHAVERSLKRLKTDWIDLYQVHWPDPMTPLEETLNALGDLVKAGKIRYFGLSNFAAWQLADAVWIGRVQGLSGLASLQCRWNLLERDSELEQVPACQYYGVGILPYFPLAAGLLSGKIGFHRPAKKDSHFGRLLSHPDHRVIGRLDDSQTMTVVEDLGRLASEYNRTLPNLAIAWLAGKDVVGSVIAGATKPEQVTANADAGESCLTDEELAGVEAVLDSHSLLNLASGK